VQSGPELLEPVTDPPSVLVRTVWPACCDVHGVTVPVELLDVRRTAVWAADRATVAVRELRPSDAPALLAELAREEVARFVPPPPSTVAGFERFIAWDAAQKDAGHQVSLGVTVGDDRPVGIFQIRALERSFRTAEWGFVLGSSFWGTGLFEASAHLVLTLAFDGIGIDRLEARTSIENGRAAAALRKVGAVPAGTLRRSFVRDGRYQDQGLWSILADEWRAPLADRSSETPAAAAAR
jgi:RimJ/RimL family protein N-acetyltransferase